MRPEATGYGAVYFCNEMLTSRGDSLDGKVVAVSGSGNVAQYTVQKVNELGGKVVTLSDQNGFVYDPQGIDAEKLDFVLQLKNGRRGRIIEYSQEFCCGYHDGKKPWNAPCQIAFPCATENEINEEDARALVKNGCIAVAEGANMPTTPEGIRVFLENKILYGPGKAANAGGVAVSGLEMSQNSTRMQWTREKVDSELRRIMKEIYCKVSTAASEYGSAGNLVVGANIAGFLKVADAMLEQGLV